MKRNYLMQECREFITPDIKEDIDFNVDIVNRIFDLLDERGLSQRDFAKLLSKNEAEISRWMQGTHNFTLKTIRLIEKKLDAHVLKVIKSKKTFDTIPAESNNYAIYANHTSKAYCYKNTVFLLGSNPCCIDYCLG